MMKTRQILNYTLAIVTVALLTVLTGCKGSDPGPELTPVEKVTQMLTSGGGKWNVPSTAGVIVDGQDVTQDLFPSFYITFTDGALSTPGNSPVWLASDTWHFKDESATVIIRGQDNKEITIKEITDDQLILSLRWDQETYGDGRTKSIVGTYDFVMSK